MSIRKGLFAFAALGACASAAAQGFFDFGQIPGVSEEPSVQVDLNPALLGFVAAAARQGDPAAADIIGGLDGIRVRVYEELQDAAAVGAFVDETSRVLERDGWQRVVYVQDGGDKVRIYAMMDGQQMSGMTVLVTDPSDAVFINIAGRIDPAQLGRVAAAMGFEDMLGLNAAAAAAAAGEADAADAPDAPDDADSPDAPDTADAADEDRPDR